VFVEMRKRDGTKLRNTTYIVSTAIVCARRNTFPCMKAICNHRLEN
jgi:hypothetical protein